MPSRDNKIRQKKPEQENDKGFVGNEEKQLTSDQSKKDTDSRDAKPDRDPYRSRDLEIEKERD